VATWEKSSADQIPCAMCAQESGELGFFGRHSTIWSEPPTTCVTFGLMPHCMICKPNHILSRFLSSPFTAKERVKVKMYLPPGLVTIIMDCYKLSAKKKDARDQLHEAITQYLRSATVHWDTKSPEINETIKRLIGKYGPVAFKQTSGAEIMQNHVPGIIESLCSEGAVQAACLPCNVGVYWLISRTVGCFGDEGWPDWTPRMPETYMRIYNALTNNETMFRADVTTEHTKPVMTANQMIFQLRLDPSTGKPDYDFDPTDPSVTVLAPGDELLVHFEEVNARAQFPAAFMEGMVIKQASKPGYCDTVWSKEGPIAAVNVQARKVTARRIGPHFSKVVTHQRSRGELVQSLRRRIAEKQIKPCLSRKLQRELNAFVTQIVQEVFSEAAIQQWIVDHPEMEELKSPTMSAERFVAYVSEGFGDLDPKLLEKIEAMVKNEVTPSKKSRADPDAEEKSARMIINDGIRNQLAALLTIRCFEDIWFGPIFQPPDVDIEDNATMPTPDACRNVGVASNIKHMRRSTAFKHMINSSKKLGRGQFVIEGDGSAWDTCCGLIIRELTENKILGKITAAVTRGWRVDVNVRDVKESASNRKVKQQKCKASAKGEAEVNQKDTFYKPTMYVIFDAIRRSGDRGTSALNQFINAVLWSFVLFADPFAALTNRDPTRRFALYLRDSHGGGKNKLTARWLPFHEGDDTHIGMNVEFTDRTPPSALHAVVDAATGTTTHVLDESVRQDFDYVKKLWKELGFNMDIVWCLPGTTSTFCGVNFLVGHHGMGEAYCPQPLRSLATSSWTINNDIIDYGPDSQRGRIICYSSYLARAAQFPNKGQASFLREMYHAIAEGYRGEGISVNSETVITQDLSRKLGYEVGTVVKLSEVYENSVEEFNWMSTDAIDRIIEITAGQVTAEELAGMIARPSIDRDILRASDLLPKSWLANLSFPSVGADDMLAMPTP